MHSTIAGILIVLFTAFAAAGQSGRLGIGARVSTDGIGITGKYFLDRSFAIEVQLNAGGLVLREGESVSAAGLIQYHLSLPQPQFRIFFGGGLHAGRWSGREAGGHPNEFILGLDGIGGIEYNFRRLPLGIGGGLKLALNYVQEVEFFPHNMIGVTARYYLGSNRIKPAAMPGRRKRR
jgi:hypothetical protein